MKFSGIDMQGDFKCQMIVDASALVWNASDESRMIYDETTRHIWIADDTEWKDTGIYNNIPLGTEMWVYADSEPDGWSLSAASGNDELVAIKGGGTYTVGGTLKGANFILPNHAHVMNNHAHSASGSLNAGVGNGKERDDGSNRATRGHTHTLSISLGSPTPGSTSTDGGSDYRPYARVGIICTR